MPWCKEKQGAHGGGQKQGWVTKWSCFAGCCELIDGKAHGGAFFCTSGHWQSVCADDVRRHSSYVLVCEFTILLMVKGYSGGNLQLTYF